MTPEVFLTLVARPNMTSALDRPEDAAAIVNAVLSLDALAGIIHAHGKTHGVTGIAEHKTDDKYRDMLAGISHSYRVLRDAAGAIKHGALDQGRKARLLTGPEAFRAVPNCIGMFRCGDVIEGSIIVIEYQPSPVYIRADDIIADSFRMLDRVVKGGAPEIDEHDSIPGANHG